MDREGKEADAITSVSPALLFSTSSSAMSGSGCESPSDKEYFKEQGDSKDEAKLKECPGAAVEDVFSAVVVVPPFKAKDPSEDASGSDDDNGEEGRASDSDWEDVDEDGGGAGFSDSDADSDWEDTNDTDTNSSSSSDDDDGDGGNDRFSGETHPFKNPVILANLFSLCPPKLLATFRLVSKQWRDLSLESWRSSIDLSFVSLENGVFLRTSRYAADIPMSEFLDYINQPEKECLTKPFRRFSLDGFQFPLTCERFEPFQNAVTSLTLTDCCFIDVSAFRQTIYASFPNLQVLSIDSCTFSALQESRKWQKYDFEEYPKAEPIPATVFGAQPHLKTLSIELKEMERIPVTWLELFSHFQTLTGLTLTVQRFATREYGLYTGEVLDIAEAIQTIRRQHGINKVPLRKFDIHPFFELPHDLPSFQNVFSLLRQLQLPLQSVKLLMNPPQEDKDKDVVHEIKYAYEVDPIPLESLIFIREYCEGPATWKFPFSQTMEYLTELMMVDVLWEDMSFLKFTPNLVKLEVVDCEYDEGIYKYRYTETTMISKTDKLDMADVKIWTLAKLTFNYDLSEADLRRLVVWLPNVEELEMPLNDKLFSIVCENWRNLDTVKVNGYDLSDDGVTGSGECQNPNRRGQLSNIVLLENLRGFDCRSPKLTDRSVFNGFQHLPSLEYVCLSKDAGVTQEGKELLEEDGVYTNFNL